MKQVEFDETLRVIRVEKSQKTAPIQRLIAELNVEIHKKGEQVHRISAEFQAMKLQRTLLIKQLDSIADVYNKRIDDFVKQNVGTLTRNLSDVSDQALVNEMTARGFTLCDGYLTHPEKPAEFMARLNLKMKNPETEIDKL